MIWWAASGPVPRVGDTIWIDRGRRYLSAGRRNSPDRLATWRDCDPLAERVREQFRVAPSRPDGHVGGGGGLGIDPHLAVLGAHLDGRDDLIAAALELLREPDRAREERQPPGVVLASELPELGRVGLALPVVAGDQPYEVELARREAGKARVEDQVARVLVMVVVVDRGPDVVQHAGRPQELAVVGIRLGDPGRREAVEDLERQARHVPRVAQVLLVAVGEVHHRRPAHVWEERRARLPPRALAEKGLPPPP